VAVSSAREPTASLLFYRREHALSNGGKLADLMEHDDGELADLPEHDPTCGE
jgi:hypothetical protein